MCHTRAAEGRRFCGACGSSLSPQCACDFPHESSDIFCGGCGAPISSVLGGAERRQLTVMFCDLADSTALSTQLDAEDLHALHRRYQSCCTEVVDRLGGYVSRYMGDGILVFFGYPRALGDDAERAVRAGLEIAHAVPRLLAPKGPDGEPVTVSVRVGIATGLVVVGDLIGKGASQEHAAVGQTPNLAARLQGLAGRDEVVVSHETFQLVERAVDATDLGGHSLKGFDGDTRAFRIDGIRDARGPLAAKAGGDSPRLVGRADELEALRRGFRQSATGAGQVITVDGEVGIGKSRLVAALVEETAEADREVIVFQCSPFHSNSALHPVVQQLRRAAGLSDGDTPEECRRRVGSLLGVSPEAMPLFARVMGISAADDEPSAGPEVEREQVLEALLHRVTAMSEASPLLIIVEDLHWVDPTTRELIERLVVLCREHNVLLVITHRPELASPWTELKHAHRVEVGFIGRDESKALAASVAGAELPDELTELIADRTDGVPLFVEELTRAVIDSGALQLQGDRYVLDGELPEGTIPFTVQDSLMARIDGLGVARELCQMGAAIGREFPRGLLRAVSSLEEARFDQAVRRLVTSGLVTEETDGADARYVFRHALIQETAYSSILREPKQRLHRQIAEGSSTRRRSPTSLAPRGCTTKPRAIGARPRSEPRLAARTPRRSR
jgi:class 3 adenylate cyclase